jgi:DNA-binding transcriptional LysR family regulator
MINLEWYRSFAAIYQLGTVSAAAEKLSLTQPAVSQHLAAMERTFDTRLFQRTPRHMQPTEDARALYAQIIGAIEQLERLSPNILRVDKSQNLKLRIGVPREFFYMQGMPLLAAAQTPSYQLELVLGQTPALLESLKSSQLDGVIATQQLSLGTLHYQPLMTEKFILVGSASMAAIAKPEDQALLSWLEQQAWISYSAELPIIRRYWQEVFGRHPSITPRLIIPDLLMILRGVELGLGISVLPEYLCREALDENRLQILWQSERASTNPLYLVCQRERRQSAEFRWLSDVCFGLTS